MPVHKASTHIMGGVQLNIKVADIVLEEEIRNQVDKNSIGYYVYRNMKFVDTTNLEDPHMITVPLKAAKAEEVCRVICQNTDDDEFYGSISFPLGTYFLANEEIVKHKWYEMWVTLFDDIEDDEFDGELGEDDAEEPKVLLSFMINDAPASRRGSPARSPRAERKKVEHVEEVSNNDAHFNVVETKIVSTTQVSVVEEEVKQTTVQEKIKDLNRKSVGFAEVQEQVHGHHHNNRNSHEANFVHLDEAALVKGETQEERNTLIERSKTTISAADQAKARRSTITGKIRGLTDRRSMKSMSEMDADELSFLFGGSAKPKPRTVNYDVRKEKDLAMMWIKSEIKKYDQDALKAELSNKLDESIHTMRKEQKDIMTTESTHFRRLERIDQMHGELKEDTDAIKEQITKMQELNAVASSSFKNFDQARAESMKANENEIESKRGELSGLVGDLQAAQASNKNLKAQIQSNRESAARDGHKGNPACVKAAAEVADAEARLLALQKENNAALKQKNDLKLANEGLKTSYNKQVNDIVKQLEAGNSKRVAVQERMFAAQDEMTVVTEANSSVKAETYLITAQCTQFKNKALMSEKRIRLLTEKLANLRRQAEEHEKAQNAELARINQQAKALESEISVARTMVEKQVSKLEQVASANAADEEATWEQQIEILEQKHRALENRRKEVQQELNNAHLSHKVVLDIFDDPHTYGMTDSETASLFKRMHELNNQMRSRGDELNKLRKIRDELEKKRHENAERNDLTQDYNAAADEYDRLAEEVRRQIQALQKEMANVDRALSSRQEVLQQQVATLGEQKLRRAELDRELLRLNRKIANLKLQIARYDADIARLLEEKSALEEKIAHLMNLIDMREAEIRDSDALINLKNRQIDFLQAILKEMAKQSGISIEPAKKRGGAYSAAKGDMLDQMLGAYINEHGCAVPIRRLGNGYYLFGTRKIYAKILNGKLVIRVGGGYMVIEEFINTYAEAELKRMDAVDAGKLKGSAEYMAMMKTEGNLIGSVDRMGSKAARASPRGNSQLVGEQNVAISGTKRKTVMSQDKLDKLKASGAARQI